MVETAGTEGNCEKGTCDVVGVVCDMWAIREEGANGIREEEN